MRGSPGIRTQTSFNPRVVLGSLFSRFLGMIKVVENGFGCLPLTQHLEGDVEHGTIMRPVPSSIFRSQLAIAQNPNRLPPVNSPIQPIRYNN